MEIRDTRTHATDLSDTSRARAAGAPGNGTRAGGPPLGAMAARVEQARSVLEHRIQTTLSQLESRISHAQGQGHDNSKLQPLIERTMARFERLAEQAVSGLEQTIARLRATRDVSPAPESEVRSGPQSPEALAAQARRELESRAQGVTSALEARISQASASGRDSSSLTELIAGARKQLSATLAAARESLELRIQSALGTQPAPTADSLRVAGPRDDSADISAAGELLALASDEGRLDGAALERLLDLQERYATGTLNTGALIESAASRILSDG